VHGWSLLTKHGIDQSVRNRRGAPALLVTSRATVRELASDPLLSSHVDWTVRDYMGRTIFSTFPITNSYESKDINPLFGAPWDAAVAKAGSVKDLLYEPGEPLGMVQLLSMMHHENVAKVVTPLVKKSKKKKRAPFFDIDTAVTQHKRTALHYAAGLGRYAMV